MSRPTKQILDETNGYDNDVLQLCAAAYGFKVRQNSKDPSHASRISHEKVILPRSIPENSSMLNACEMFLRPVQAVLSKEASTAAER